MIFAANWAVQRFGLVPVGFGLRAPAAVYFVGLAFTLRDLVQNILGRWVSVAAIAPARWSRRRSRRRWRWPVGSPSSAPSSPTSLVYTPLLRRGWIVALVPANLAGCVVDSLVFLSIAFGSLSLLGGQVLGKAWMTALAVLLLAPLRRWYALTPGRDSRPPGGAAA